LKLRNLLLLGVFHFLVDSYAAVFGPLVALARFSDQKIGMLGTLFGVSTSFTQLLFGYLADRFNVRLIILGGLAMAAIFMSMAGNLVSQPILFAVALVLGGLGIAAFHPAAVVMAARTLPDRPTVGVSIFIAMGTAGFAAAPVLYMLFAETYGLRSTFILLVPGLMLLPLVLKLPRRKPGERRSQDSPLSRFAGVQSFLVTHGPALLPIYIVVVARSMVQISIVQFLPKLMLDRGHTTTEAGLASTVYIAGAALGMLCCGLLATRYNRRSLQAISLIAGVPMTLLFLLSSTLPLIPALGLLGVSGFFVLSTNTMHIVMGQELSPRHASTISSLVMGFGWGVGSLGSYIAGRLADPQGLGLGLEVALAIICCVPLLTLPLTFYLRGRPLEAGVEGAAAEPVVG
jgi:FSR family fosmidomycin resistance protein-like MFS transporter